MKWKDYSFKIKDDAASSVKVDISLVQSTTSLANTAEDFLRKNASLLVDTARDMPSKF